MTVLEARIARIRTEADDILSTAGLLKGLRENSACWTSPAFDVRMAVRNLREAADKLDSIANRSE